MAGDWIKMRANLDTDPSVIMMAAAFNTDELCIVGRLWKVWAWADQHSADGNAVRVTTTFLDRITNCPGFAKAMRDAGWLEGRDGALTFPHFDRHNGQPAKTRALTKDRVKEHRNAIGVTKPLPEKRREEKIVKTPQPPKGGRAREGLIDLKSENLDQFTEAEAVYALYPRKTKNRMAALRAIRAVLLETDLETLKRAVGRYAKTPGLDRENGRGIPGADKWFGNGCWKDYATKPKASEPVPVVPSKALNDLRYMFDRADRIKQTQADRTLTLHHIDNLVSDDDQFLSIEEKGKIATMKGGGNV